jgi:hypothetical protein
MKLTARTPELLEYAFKLFKIPDQIRDLPKNILYKVLSDYGIQADPEVIDEWKDSAC